MAFYPTNNVFTRLFSHRKSATISTIILMSSNGFTTAGPCLLTVFDSQIHSQALQVLSHTFMPSCPALFQSLLILATVCDGAIKSAVVPIGKTRGEQNIQLQWQASLLATEMSMI